MDQRDNSEDRNGTEGPSPGADVVALSPVPAQMWQGWVLVPVQMWEGWASPSADVAGVGLVLDVAGMGPVPMQMWQG